MRLIFFLIIGVIVVSGCIQVGDTNTQPTDDTPQGQDTSPPKPDPQTDKTYCEKDSDCVTVGDGGCGTIVVNRETAKDWDSNEGPICIAPTFANNPRCESSICVADYSYGQNAPLESFTVDLSVKLKIHDNLPKSISIQNDGTVTFAEGEVIKRQIGISKEEMEELKQLILENDFFSLDEEYFGGGYDFIADTINVTIGNKTHSVYCYSQCPEGFDEILGKITNIWPYEIEYQGFA